MSTLDRVLLGLAGLCGLLGVAASAAAAHLTAGESLRTAAQFLLFHAPLVVGLVALSSSGRVNARAAQGAAAAVCLGLGLFSGDLAMRAIMGVALFPYAAPAGGIVLMLAWLMTAVIAVLPIRR